MADNKTIVWIVVGIIVLAFAWNSGLLPTLGNNNQSGGGTTTVITAATTNTLIGRDALSAGTAVSGTSQVSVNGGPFGADDFSISTSPGEVLDVLIINGTTYHNTVLLDQTVPNSVTAQMNAKLYKNATVTVTVYDQFTLLDAAGLAANASISSGETKNLDVYMQGTSEQSTQDMVCVLESSNNTAVEEVILAGAGASKSTRGKPSSYTLLGTGSSVWIYDLAPIDSSAKRQYTLTIKSKSGQDASNSQFKIACMTKENFLDSKTGNLAYDIEDSQGNLKSMATYSFSDYLN